MTEERIRLERMLLRRAKEHWRETGSSCRAVRKHFKPLMLDLKKLRRTKMKKLLPILGVSLFLMGNTGCGSGLEVKAAEDVLDELVSEACKFLPHEADNKTPGEKLDHLIQAGCENLPTIEKIIQSD